MELLRGTIELTAVTQVVIATAAAIGLIYLQMVLVTLLISMLLAFALDPIVVLLARIRVPRPAGAAVALLLVLLSLALGTCIFFYNRAIDFADELPKYSTAIREHLRQLQDEAEKLEANTGTIMPRPNGKRPVIVEVQDGPRLTKIFSSSATRYRDLLLPIGFVPFLIYFMLTWKSHVHSATLQIFAGEQRPAAFRTMAAFRKWSAALSLATLLSDC
jgi:predicted PurR-regulated permease PerM